MKKSKHTHKTYYDRKMARAEETMRVLAKLTLILVPVVVLLQLVVWAVT